MLAKCTNPSCSASFLHLDEGQLFRLETDFAAGSSYAKATEYFWLCGPCSAGMSLHLAQNGTVTVTGLREALRNAPEAARISLNHENGLFFRSVSFLRRSHPKGT